MERMHCIDDRMDLLEVLTNEVGVVDRTGLDELDEQHLRMDQIQVGEHDESSEIITLIEFEI